MKPLIIHALGIVLTYDCDVVCDHCCNGIPDQENNPPPTWEKCKTIIDRVADLGFLRSLGITGGEPILHYELLKRVYAYAKREYNISSSLNTNCNWAVSDTITEDVLSQLKDAGLSVIGLSVDKYHQKSISIEKINRVIDVSYRLGLKVVVQTITSNHKWDLAYTKKILGKRAEMCYEFHDSPVTPRGNAASRIPTSELPYRKELGRGCSVFSIINVDMSGDVVFCCGSVPKQSLKLFGGNIFYDDLSKLFTKMAYNPILNSLYVEQGPKKLMEISDKYLHSTFCSGEYTSVCHACISMIESDYIIPLMEYLQTNSTGYFLQRQLLDFLRRKKNKQNQITNENSKN
jgi:organic radical activating enzyme